MAIVDVVVIPVGTEGPSVNKYIVHIFRKNFKNIKQWVKLIFN